MMKIGASTTRVKFDYQAESGSYIAFRVTAARNNLASPASVAFALGENGGGPALGRKMA